MTLTFSESARLTHEAWRLCAPWHGPALVSVIDAGGRVQPVAGGIGDFDAGMGSVATACLGRGILPAGLVLHGVTEHNGTRSPLSVIAPMDGDPWVIIDDDDSWQCEPELAALVARWLTILASAGN